MLRGASRTAGLIVLVTLLFARSEARAGARFALIVGHNLGHAFETPLRWAEEDADRVFEVLTQIGDVHPARAVLLKSPSSEALERSWLTLLGQLKEATHRGEHTTLIFYYSGHGDKNALHLGAEALEISTLKAQLKAAGASATVAIVDACQNDLAPRAQQKGASRAPPFAWRKNEVEAPEGFVYLTSAASGEIAQESNDIQGSLFTHHLVAGLRGSADVDEDGAVTLFELYRYGYTKTLSDTHAKTMSVQHSELQIERKGRGALILSYPSLAVSTLELAENVQGHLLIIHDQSGRVVGEHHRSKGGPRRFALTPGVYRLQLRNREGVRIGLVSLGRGAHFVPLSALKEAPQRVVLAKGARYDPHPVQLGVGVGAARSFVPGFGVLPMLELFGAYRLSRALQLGLWFLGGFTLSESEVWRYRQFELSLGLSLDWIFALDFVSLSAGLRLGAAATLQRAERDAGTLLDTLEVPRTQNERALGPEGALVAGAEFRLSSRFSLRVELGPSAALIRVDGERAFRWRLFGAALGVFRL